MKHLDAVDLIFIAGLTVIGYGLYSMWRPAGIIFAGGCVCALAVTVWQHKRTRENRG